MCGSLSGRNKNEPMWQSELPTEEGDWLWVVQWSCGCVLNSGIAWVTEIPEGESKDHYFELPSGMALSWEGQNRPVVIEEVSAWARIDLPTPLNELG